MGRRRRKRKKRTKEPVKKARMSLSPTSLPIWVWFIALIIILIVTGGTIIDYLTFQESVIELTQNNEMIRAGGNLLPANLPMSPSP